MASFADEVQYWTGRCAAYNWAACPLSFPTHQELVVDDPVSAASDVSVTRSFSIGVPHPQYGVMRASMSLTSAPSLTRLSSVAHRVAANEFATAQGMPQLYVGCGEFRDVIDGREAVVVGVLVFRSRSDGVQCAPMTLVDWHGMWLPYFEDRNQWVMTGWDSGGTVVEIHKPFGWNCALLPQGYRAVEERVASTRCSRRRASSPCTPLSDRYHGSGGCDGCDREHGSSDD